MAHDDKRLQITIRSSLDGICLGGGQVLMDG
jgi:hypothetical protein